MNRKKCKNCKEYFRPEKPLQHYCLESECVKAWVKSEKDKQWKKRKRIIKGQIKTTQETLAEAQVAFNAYIRARDFGKECISCGTLLKGKFDAGHFFSQGGHANLRFSEKNTNGQCVKCNRYLHGNLLDYRNGIIKRYGESVLRDLEQNANAERKYTRKEAEEIRDLYKLKTRDLLKKS